MTQPVEAGTLQPLNDLVAAWPEAERQDFVFPVSTTTLKGEVFSLLHELRTDLFWYRKDILQKAGLPVPKLWSEVAETAGKLANPRLIGYGVGASSQQGAAAIAEWFHPMIWGAGGELFDSEGRAVINGEAGVRALSWLRDLVRVHKGAPASIANITNRGPARRDEIRDGRDDDRPVHSTEHGTGGRGNRHESGDRAGAKFRR